SWPGSASSGHRSSPVGTPSASGSAGSNGAHSVAPGLSGQGSQASPSPSPSKSAWTPPSSGRTGLNTSGQLSSASGTPSPSTSPSAGTPVYTVEPSTLTGRDGTQVGSPSGAPQ